MRLRSLRLLAAAGAALALCAACSRKAEEGQAPTPANVTLTAEQRQHIGLYTVVLSKYHKAVDAAGAVDYDNDQATSVIAPFSGPVSRLLVAPGDRVGKGAPLAVVDSPDFTAALSAYAKALATAETNRKVADMDKDLVQHNGVSQREADQAQTDAANAEADRDAALQALAGLNVDPQVIRDIQAHKPVSTHASGQIRAPIAGTVVERLITPGQLLQAGTTASFTIADLSKVWVMAQISGSDLGSVKVGDPAEVDTGLGPPLSGTVGNIGALVNPDTRQVLARVVVDNPQNALKKDMYVRVRIQSRAEGSGVLVPVSAILRDDENLPFVYVAQADGSFARQHVTLGDRIGDQYVIAAGLNMGAQVVVDGGVFVQFMQNQ